MFIFIAMLLIISLLAYALVLKLELRPIIKSNGLVINFEDYLQIKRTS